MKKALILADAFPPAFAPRLGYLCKYLAENNWEATVISETINTEKDFQHLTGFASVRFILAKRKFKFKILYLLNLILSKIYLDLETTNRNRQFITIADELFKFNDFCLVVGFTCNYFPLNVALKISSKYKVPLIIDLRDIYEQYPQKRVLSFKLKPFLYNLRHNYSSKIKLLFRNNILRNVSGLVTVSFWHMDVLKKYNKNVKLIFNGFDPEIFQPKLLKTEKFRICYTGRLYFKEFQDPSYLFASVFLLIKQGIISQNEIEINFYSGVKSKTLISDYSNQFKISSIVNCYDYVGALEIPEILNNSSILLLLSNKSDTMGPKGIMTTKFFEYIGVNRPILCVRSDESNLELAINQANAGVAARNIEEAYNFIKAKFLEWKSLGYTIGTTNMEIAKQYSRREQAKQFATFFDLITYQNNEVNIDA